MAMRRDNFSLSIDLKMNSETLSKDSWVLSPKGSIDSVTSNEFKNRIEKLFEENGKMPNLLLDMAGVKYISSVGLGALIGLFKKCRESGSSFALFQPQLAVQRVLEISKLDFLLLKPDQPETYTPFLNYVERAKLRQTSETKAADSKA